jgi:transcriptional regulator
LVLSDLYIDVICIERIPVADSRSPLLSGTLDLLILKTLSVGVLHGYGIAQHIHRLSREALSVEEGSLYPALQRMAARGWVSADWKQTPTGRRARYYRITAAGRRQLGIEEESFRKSVAATTRVLRGAES